MNIAIIPARGGSKRIPKKNIREFLGRPVISYSIEIEIYEIFLLISLIVVIHLLNLDLLLFVFNACSSPFSTFAVFEWLRLLVLLKKLSFPFKKSKRSPQNFA